MLLGTLTRVRRPAPLLPLLIALLLLTLPGRSSAQEEGTTGLSALELPLGARPLGMGRAFVAVPGDLQGLLYNPAGVATRDSAGLTFSRYQGASDLDVNGNYVAGSVPVLGGVLTAAFNYEDLGEIELTGGSPEPLGTADLRNIVAVGSFGVDVTEAIALGASAKYLSSDLGAGEGTGFAFDAGALVRPVSDFDLTLGAAVLNVGPDIEFDIDDELGGETEGAGDPLPSRLRWGAALVLRGTGDDVEAGNSDYGFLLATDVEHNLRELGDVSLHAGGELDYRRIVTVRGGFVRLVNSFGGESANGFSLGAGVRWQQLRVDVAREIGVNEIGDETHFSLGVDF